jgi:hypothetical protein
MRRRRATYQKDSVPSALPVTACCSSWPTASAQTRSSEVSYVATLCVSTPYIQDQAVQTVRRDNDRSRLVSRQPRRQ